MKRRCYLPVTAADLRDLARSGHLPVGGRPAYAVTAALRAANPSATDVEDLEYLAYEEAVAAAHDPVVVVALDAAVGADLSGSLVALAGAVAAADVASFHVADDAADDDGHLLWYDATELDLVRDRLA